MRGKIAFGIALACLAAANGQAHDTWVQTNTNLIRVGDAVHVDLMLGNHGNDHRDFKLAGKLNPSWGTLAVIGPNGKETGIKENLADLGYASNEGFWSTRHVATEPGLHMVAHTLDKVVPYAPVRAIKSGKTFFVASKSLDKPTADNPGFDRVLGHPFELVPEANPVTPMGPGTPIRVRLLFKGNPMPDARVSFIPRGESLTEDFDSRYERKTNEQGRAVFNPTSANYYLVVAHHSDAESGQGYQSTKYSATLTVFVPQICPCCGE